MSKQVRIRRGTTLQHASFTGADGEVTFDTDLKCLRVHDGATPGGDPVRPVKSVGASTSDQICPTGLIVSGDGSDGIGLRVTKNAQVDGTLAAAGPFNAVGLSSFIGEVAINAAFRRGVSPITYAASVTFALASSNAFSITLAGNLTVALSGLAAGRVGSIFILADGSPRNLTFPAAWRFLGSAVPASIAASKAAHLSVVCLDATDAGVRARWLVEP